MDAETPGEPTPGEANTPGETNTPVEVEAGAEVTPGEASEDSQAEEPPVIIKSNRPEYEEVWNW